MTSARKERGSIFYGCLNRLEQSIENEESVKKSKRFRSPPSLSHFFPFALLDTELKRDRDAASLSLIAHVPELSDSSEETSLLPVRERERERKKNKNDGIDGVDDGVRIAKPPLPRSLLACWPHARAAPRR